MHAAVLTEVMRHFYEYNCIHILINYSLIEGELVFSDLKITNRNVIASVGEFTS